MVIYHTCKYWIPRKDTRDGPSSLTCNASCKGSSCPIVLVLSKLRGSICTNGERQGTTQCFFLRPHCPLSFFSWPLSSSEDSGFFRLFVHVLHCLTLCVAIHCCGFSAISMLTCISNPDLSIAPDSCFLLFTGHFCPRVPKTQTLAFDKYNTSHFFNFSLSITLHKQLGTEN